MIGSSRAWQLLTGVAGAWLLTSPAVTGCFAERDLTDVVGAGGAPTAACPGELCAAFLHTCTDGQRDGDETGTDCGGSCARCPDGQPCLTGADCQSAVCTAAQCAPPTCDDGARNGAETDVDCGGTCDQGCAAGQRCAENADCAGEQCSAQDSTCLPTCTDGVTNGGETDVDCGGPCAGCEDGEACGSSSDNCAGERYCDPSGVCAPQKVSGSSCKYAVECLSSYCVDDVCCSSSCDGTCQSCDAPSGTCNPIKKNEDPDDECAGPDVCDGDGACKKSLGESCADKEECASGECADNVCCYRSCAKICEACVEAKTGLPDGTCAYIPNGGDPDAECSSPGTCTGNGSCSAGAKNGVPCAFWSDCSSQKCVDGVCCETDCLGTCKACDVPESAGTCSLIPQGFDPDNECPSGPNLAGTCNGMAACQ
ncbi:MAG: hypothetical protein R3F14_22360 [Polyangiaceae bacterium]